ncbi:hypothetical protein IFM89_023246 [Coptis chinensis]|uniref:RNase III domain-containing protein n=1 Tax=Coptis chinensis TaxID=261450 RepID=A0A835HXF3_9MAGN|nr:hypothetical protein IFM89_023246 [Coptis chinensis]
MVGQFAMPRSDNFEDRDGVKLPSLSLCNWRIRRNVESNSMESRFNGACTGRQHHQRLEFVGDAALGLTFANLYSLTLGLQLEVDSVNNRAVVEGCGVQFPVGKESTKEVQLFLGNAVFAKVVGGAMKAGSVKVGTTMAAMIACGSWIKTEQNEASKKPSQ